MRAHSLVGLSLGCLILLAAFAPGQAGTPRMAAPPASALVDAGRAEQHVQQGMTYIKMRDYENAIIEFSRAIELMPNFAVAYADRGIAYMQQRKLNKAMDDLQKAAGLAPGDKSIHYNLTALYCLQGAKDRAFDSLDKALDLGFNNYDALRTDPDLDVIREEPEFRKILEKYKVFIR